MSLSFVSQGTTKPSEALPKVAQVKLPSLSLPGTKAKPGPKPKPKTGDAHVDDVQPKPEPANKQKYRLQDLPPERLAAVDTYLLADHPVDKLVQIILNDWKEFPGGNPDSIRRVLYRYKAKGIKIKQAKLAAKHTSNLELQALVGQINDLEKRLNPVLMLENLVLTQQARLDRLDRKERKLNTLLPEQTKNVGLMGDLLGKLISAQLETGVLVRAVKTKTSVSVNAGGTTVTVSEGREQLTNALAEGLSLLTEHGVFDVQATEVPSAGD